MLTDWWYTLRRYVVSRVTSPASRKRGRPNLYCWLQIPPRWNTRLFTQDSLKLLPKLSMSGWKELSHNLRSSTRFFITHSFIFVQLRFRRAPQINQQAKFQLVPLLLQIEGVKAHRYSTALYRIFPVTFFSKGSSVTFLKKWTTRCQWFRLPL